MLFIYVFLSFFFIYKSYQKYGRLINILSIYIIIWVLNVSLYELKLIEYNNLTPTTWGVLFLNIILFSLGCLLKKRLLESDTSYLIVNKSNLRKYIIGCIVISSLAIIPNIIMLMNHYGINILQHTTAIYVDALSGQSIFTIPYLGSFALLGVLLSSIYFFTYGFHYTIIFPFVLTFLDILPTGSRGALIIAFLFTIVPALFIPDKKLNFFSKKNISILIGLSIILVSGFLILTKNRSQNATEQPYSSELMIEIAEFSPILYKNYEYFTSPIGVLNEFLKNPRFVFGINMFSVERNIINKLGGNVQYERFQPFYDVPIRTNVGTYLTELSEDFTIPGMLMFVFLLSYCFDYLYQLNKMKRNVFIHVTLGFFGTIIYMSWFSNFLRHGNITIIMFMILAFFFYKLIIEHLSIKKNQSKSEKNNNV